MMSKQVSEFAQSEYSCRNCSKKTFATHQDALHHGTLEYLQCAFCNTRDHAIKSHSVSQNKMPVSVAPRFDISELTQKIRSKKRVLQRIRAQTATILEQTEDWQYHTKCSLCNHNVLLRIDFPACMSCQANLGQSVCSDILEEIS